MGDWLSHNANTPREVIGTAYFAYSTHLIAQCAEALGKKADADRFNRLHKRIREAFREKFVSADGRVQGETQTAYVLALQFDLLNPKEAQLAREHLRADIESRNGHLSTGFVGTKDLMTCLTKVGLSDVAYRLFHNKTFPSWGFSVVQGATSVWERWDGLDTNPDGSVRLRGSLAHYAYGAVAEWMYRTIGGIEPLEPGYRRVRIHPQPGGKIRWAKTRYESIRGEIQTDWRVQDQRMTLKVTVPPAMTAELVLPTDHPSHIKEAKESIQPDGNIRFVRSSGSSTVLRLNSGTYEFSVALTPEENKQNPSPNKARASKKAKAIL